jgi:hypothetical protein
MVSDFYLGTYPIFIAAECDSEALTSQFALSVKILVNKVPAVYFVLQKLGIVKKIALSAKTLVDNVMPHR